MWLRRSVLATASRSCEIPLTARPLTTVSASVRLYRIVQRQIRELERILREQQPDLSADESPSCLLQPPLFPQANGSFRVFSSNTDIVYNKSSITSFSPSADLYRLFYVWSLPDDEDDDQTVIRGKDPDKNQSTSDRQIEVKRLEWFLAVSGISPEPSMDQHLQHLVGAFLPSLWTSLDDLRTAVREAFRSFPSTDSNTSFHRSLAIQAYQQLVTQCSLQRRTSVSTSNDVCITATSQWIGRSLSTPPKQRDSRQPAPSHLLQNHFAYRVRMVNQHPDRSIQLLGRTWRIFENNHSEGNTPPLVVHAPLTGAVGQFPVLPPGHVFEYMSGSALLTDTGHMEGSFHWAVVPPGTPSGQMASGLLVDAVEAYNEHQHRQSLEQQKDAKKGANPTTTKAVDYDFFEVPVEPFQLMVPDAARTENEE